MNLQNRFQHIWYFLLFFFLIYGNNNSIFAATGIGRYGATFLQVHSGARQVGMAEAYTALAYKDINLMRYNIGGLGSIRNIMLAVNYHKWIEDTQQGAVKLAIPTRFGVIGFDFTYFNAGELTEIDPYFNRTGNILTNNDIALSLGYGSSFRMLNQNFLYGGGIKIVRQNLANESATAIGLDLGLLLWLKHLSFGLSLQNFTVTRLEFIAGQKESLPETIRGGIGGHFNIGGYINWNVDCDLAYSQQQDIRYYVGTEFIINEIFMLRGGYKIHDYDVNRWAAGCGLLIPMAWLVNSETRLDYAYSPMDAFNASTHRFSLLFRFGVPVPGMKINAPNRRELDQIREQLEKEVEAAAKARIAAEEAEKRTRALEDSLRARLERIKKIAEESGGKIEVVEKADAKPGEIKDQIHLRMRINFDFDRANIRVEEYETMHRVAEILNTYPESQVFMAGHSDYVGTHEYNMHLSQVRVDSVMAFLTKKENINVKRFYNPIGYGKLKPIAENTTEEGRFQNRRVDFLIYTSDTKPEMPEASALKAIQLIDNSTIHIIANGKVTLEHRTFDDPQRLVVDFPGIFPLTVTKSFEIYRGPFIRARVGFHPEKLLTRVAFDLYRPIQYEIVTKDNIAIIKLIEN